MTHKTDNFDKWNAACPDAQSAPTPRPAQSAVRLDRVMQMTTLSRATIYRLMKKGAFPSNRSLSPGRTGWLLCDIIAWLENR